MLGYLFFRVCVGPRVRILQMVTEIVVFIVVHIFKCKEFPTSYLAAAYAVVVDVFFKFTVIFSNTCPF